MTDQDFEDEAAEAAAYKFLSTLADLCVQITEEEEVETLKLVADNGSCAAIFKQKGY